MTRVLSLNGGSSSLKYAVFEVEGDSVQAMMRASIDGIGSDVADQATAVNKALGDIEQRGLVPCAVVGHRVVHGGAKRSAPARVDDALLAELTDLVPLSPLHLPGEISAIRAVANRWRDCPQVVCFDTAFHRTLSEVAQRYALPEELHQAGLRRYGFHGLSYEHVVETLGAASLGRAVIAHLGSGASVAAVRDGRAVDTTMGFTPAGGLVMGTRTGDLDPGLLVYLAGSGKNARELEDIVNRRGGLLGISGRTSDVRELLALREHDTRAALALDVFVWSARKWIAAMTASLGGIETLVFTGGIGEHASRVRADIAGGLNYLGVRVDETRNESVRGTGLISPDGAPCIVRVVTADEERMVALHAARMLA